jgi:hypothetical protein
MPTPLEHLIRDQVRQTTVHTLSRQTEKLTEEIARDFIRDPETQAWLKTLVKQVFGDTLTRLRRNGRPKQGPRLKIATRRRSR